MTNNIFTGISTAIITPFDEKLNINFNKLEELLEYQIKSGVKSITIAGTTGEASVLNMDEYVKLIKFTIEVINKRVPVIAGSGSNCTNKAIECSLISQKLGVDALLSITPYYNKANQEGIFHHFKEISKNVNLPIILYNVPSRTNVDIDVITYKRLSSIKNIIGVKETTTHLDKILKIKDICKNNFYVYCGNDELIYNYISSGADGAISVLSNIVPKITNDIFNFYFNNKIKDSRHLQTKYLTFITYLFKDINPIPIKIAMNIKGLNVGNTRLPLVIENKNIEKLLSYEMKNLNII